MCFLTEIKSQFYTERNGKYSYRHSFIVIYFTETLEQMQGKLTDSTMKYFIAISENKKKELELKNTEFKIEGEQKKMLTRYWKDKIDVFDEMIRLNVRTPTYSGRDTPGTDRESDGRITLGPMKIDAKLMSGKPMSLQRGKKGLSSGIEPVISIEGSDAVCYPNKEARKGRKVALNIGVLRRMEQCKALAESIESLHDKTERDYDTSSSPYWRDGLSPRRPFTAPRGGTRWGKSGQKRNAKSAGAGVRPEATPLVGPAETNDISKPTEEPSTNRKKLASPAGPTSLTMSTAKRLASMSSSNSTRILSASSTSTVSTDKRLLSTSSVS